ncbi:MAG: type II secretion system protein [Thermoleophilia bacterium]
MAAARTIPRRRLRDERGFALLEPTVGAIVLGALVVATVPSLLLMRGRADDPAARANVRAAVPALAGWFADHATYAGATYEQLRDGYVSGLPRVELSHLTDTGYCVESTVGSTTSSQAGPAAPIVDGACP